ncbi:uncharacterized protein L3040_002082 [Drepanopeziza brunnea f. sp. 'multigermtubi']|uniref:uncharacterized protein n=1 Tax=Drepanopeziza brunnea f. sp. 'multigermtubi' TaxID=698441 RepID=UPI002383EBCA|nr:hypothetical protein L3040_002082 [Drepanopeziza brunnea f. sp. 'multigermtubi']
MPPTQIPIDGLWRCLCPAINGIVISSTSPRTVTARRILTARGTGSDQRPNSPRALHTATEGESAALGTSTYRTTSIDTSASAEAPRTFGYRDRNLESGSHQHNLSLKKPPLMRTVKLTTTGTGADNPATFDSNLWSRQIPRPGWASQVSEAQRLALGTIRQALDHLSILQIHDLLRNVRAEKKSYERVVSIVEYLILDRGEKPALIHYDSLIRANASCTRGSAGSVRMLMEEMKAYGIIADSGLYHGALQALAIHPDYLLRAEIMQEMKERWLGLSPEGWHSLVVGLIRDRQYEVAMDKLEEMHSEGIIVLPWLYDIFLFRLCEADELDEAFKLLKYRFDNSRNEILPTMWYYLLDMFSKDLHYEGTKYIWKRRVDTENLVLSDGICLSALNLAARYADPELATSVIRILSSRKSPLTAFHYEALLAAYAGAGDLKTAFRVLVIMTKAGLQTDASTTRPLFLTLSKSRDLAAKAWVELEELTHDSHVLPVAAANVVIEATIHTGQVEKAVELYKRLHDICKSGPDTETFNALLQGTSRHDRKDLSMFLAGEMQALGIKPDYLTYDRLILACLKHDDYEDAFRYLEEMVDVGADQPDGGWYMRPGTAKLMIERCVENDDQRAWKILDEMDRRQMKTFSLRDWADQKWKGPPRDTDLKAKVAMWATV